MDKMKDHLNELLTHSYNEQKRYFLKMSGQARATVGKVDDWSPKDVMAHVVHWDSMTAADLSDPDNRPPDQPGEDYNRTNARIWEKYKDEAWSDIEALVDQTHEALVENVKQFSEEDISDPERFEWLNGRAVWRSMAFTNHYHPLQPVAVLYADQGDLAYANQLQEEAAEKQLKLSDADDWRGTVHYNLGCHYAVTGQADQAFKNIDLGLKTYPVLSKWAQDDPDMDNLRDDPRFATIVKSE